MTTNKIAVLEHAHYDDIYGWWKPVLDRHGKRIVVRNVTRDIIDKLNTSCLSGYQWREENVK